MQILLKIDEDFGSRVRLHEKTRKTQRTTEQNPCVLWVV